MLPALKAAKAWEVMAASAAGSRHQEQGKACEDAWLAASLEDGALFLAVADGAGSATRAAEASALALETALEALAAVPNLSTALELRGKRPLLETLRKVRGTLEEAAQGRLGDFATTLALAVLTERWLAALHVGDGAIVVQGRKGEVVTLSAPRHGRYAGETVFVTSPDYLAQARYTFLPTEAVQGVALFTDGLEAMALELATMRAHGPFFKPLFAFASNAAPERVEALAAFLDSERLAERGDDDKTLVLAVRSPSASRMQAIRSPLSCMQAIPSPLTSRMQAIRS